MKKIIKNRILKRKYIYLIKIFKIFLLLVYSIYIIKKINKRKRFKKIGIIGLAHSQNIGNNLLTFSNSTNYFLMLYN